MVSQRRQTSGSCRVRHPLCCSGDGKLSTGQSPCSLCSGSARPALASHTGHTECLRGTPSHAAARWLRLAQSAGLSSSPVQLDFAPVAVAREASHGCGSIASCVSHGCDLLCPHDTLQSGRRTTHRCVMVKGWTRKHVEHKSVFLFVKHFHLTPFTALSQPSQ